jgi:hypothetical protein
VPGRPASGRRPPTAFALLTVFATGAALFALVFAQVLLGKAGISEAQVERRVAEQQSRVDQLGLEVQRLRAPARIAAAAAKLGMVPAADVIVIDATGAAARAASQQHQQQPAQSTVRGPSPKRGRT